MIFFVDHIGEKDERILEGEENSNIFIPVPPRTPIINTFLLPSQSKSNFW